MLETMVRFLNRFSLSLYNKKEYRTIHSCSNFSRKIISDPKYCRCSFTGNIPHLVHVRSNWRFLSSHQFWFGCTYSPFVSHSLLDTYVTTFRSYLKSFFSRLSGYHYRIYSHNLHNRIISAPLVWLQKKLFFLFGAKLAHPELGRDKKRFYLPAV